LLLLFSGQRLHNDDLTWFVVVVVAFREEITHWWLKRIFRCCCCFQGSFLSGRRERLWRRTQKSGRAHQRRNSELEKLKQTQTKSSLYFLVNICLGNRNESTENLHKWRKWFYIKILLFIPYGFFIQFKKYFCYGR